MKDNSYEIERFDANVDYATLLYEENIAKRKAQKQILEEKIDAKLKQIEGKEYRRKKRKLDEIKALEEQ